MSTFSVEPLTCSLLDATWFMSLPEVLNPEIQTVKIYMQPDQVDNLFTFSEETNTVFLNENTRLKVLNGDICPAVDTISLVFDLHSNILTSNTQKLNIPVK